MKNLVKRKSLKLITYLGCLLMILVVLPHTAVAQTNEVNALKRSMAELQAQLEAMQQKLDEIDENVSQNTQAVEVTAEAVESYGGQSSFWDKTTMGGYGELHYNSLSAEDSEHDLDRLDFHRFVLFFGHEFSDRLRFFSEVELEHALAGDGEDKPGEVELEQAFVEYDFNERNSARAGVFLLPIGILNETHEPPTFYGVERNTVENVIIPTTWWAGGVGYTHRSDTGFTFDLALHEGLELDPDSARIRSGRQKTANASADDLAVTGRVKYTGTPGLELAASFQYQSDITQEGQDTTDDALLYEAHVVYNRGPFGLRALYAGWDLDVDDRIDDPENDDPTVLIDNPLKVDDYDEQQGWYIEPSFKMTPKFGVFARYEDVEGGRSRDEFDQWTIGFNYWVGEDVVLKADFQDREHDNTADSGRDFDGFNLGVGYEF